MNKLVIKTKGLGNVEVDSKDIIRFPEGLYGFENAKKFVLLSGNEEGNPFMWLQCADSCEPRFVVIDPFKIFNDYNIPANAISPLIKLDDNENLRVLAITTITKGAKDIYVNLKCPIVINARENIATQIILDNEDYPIRYYMYKGRDSHACTGTPQR